MTSIFCIKLSRKVHNDFQKVNQMVYNALSPLPGGKIVGITTDQKLEISKMFGYRKPTKQQAEAKVYIQTLVIELAEAIVDLTRKDREQAVALKRLQDFKAWADLAIMR